MVAPASSSTRWAPKIGHLAVLVCVAACAPDPAAQPAAPQIRWVYEADAEPIAPVADGVDPTSEPWPPAQVGTDTGQDGIIYAAVLGGYYILRVQNPRGDYKITYDADANEFNDEGWSLHRTCGTTYTQAWMYRLTGREEFRASAERGLRFVTGQAVEQPDGSLRVADVGGTSIFALALTEYARLTGDASFDATIDKVGAHVLARLREDPYDDNSIGPALRRGQTMQGLWHLYAYTREVVYLDALETLATEIYEDPFLHGDSVYFALWANEPLTELYRERGLLWIPDFVAPFADAVVALQYGAHNTADPTWHGAFVSAYGKDARWDSCLRLESVIDAQRLAAMAGQTDRANEYAAAARRAVAFQLGLQVRATDLARFDDGDLIVGAFPFDHGDNQMRADVTHHCANAMIKTVDYLDLEDYPGAP